jgi:hypothetical protein
MLSSVTDSVVYWTANKQQKQTNKKTKCSVITTIYAACSGSLCCELQVRECTPFDNRFMKIEKLLMVPAG